MMWMGALLSALIVVAAGLAFQHVNGIAAGTPASDAVPTFAGGETCANCHQAEAQAWRTSQHRLAMDHATEKSVLGDFNDASFDYYGVHSRFFRKDGKFFVETDGPDGKLATFEVKYTFGVDPLQQYLIEFPDGRLQALSLAWETRPKDKGGQRWFHLYPNENISHDDVLHWTKLNQNWNFMCAECHSTGVRKNYDAAQDRFASTWAEISIGCEACHGQGSAHVAWAHQRQSWWPFGKRDDPSKGLLIQFDERRDITWQRDDKTGNPKPSAPPAALRKEVETCGFCHARRAEFSEDWLPGHWLSDTHVVAPMTRGLYHADGQMRDREEVYDYAPFKQSRMFAAGVTCSDCHDPHSARLRLARDNVCLQCHAPEKYAAVAHNRHEGVDPPLACVSCHMPARTYMVIDRRHDHSFRVPRPDLSVKLGTPNACNDCHADKSPQWAAEAIERWHGPDRKGFQTYAAAFHSAWADQTDAPALLASMIKNDTAPAFVRASALSTLASHVSPENIDLARRGLADKDPMVRIGALDMLANLPPAQIWTLAAPTLSDSSRGVRIRAADLLAAVPSANLPAADRARFDSAAAEFVAAQRLNADRPEARSTLGSFFARRGLFADAEAEYKAALRLSPQFAPAAVNLADLYRQTGRDGEGIDVLRTSIAASPREAGLHHALGLALVRAKRADEALAELRHAAELDPGEPRYAYVYAVALNSSGRREEAINVLKATSERHPNDRDTLMALLAFYRDAGDLNAALDYAERLARMSPGDRDLANFVEGLRQQIKKEGAQ
jgi:predicted CXXCH cytochrome family protein